MWHDQDVAGRDAIWQKRWGIAHSVTIGVDGPTKLTLAYYHLETDELPDSGFPYFYTIGNAPGGQTLSEPAIGVVTTIGGVTGHVDRDKIGRAPVCTTVTNAHLVCRHLLQKKQITHI